MTHFILIILFVCSLIGGYNMDTKPNVNQHEDKIPVYGINEYVNSLDMFYLENNKINVDSDKIKRNEPFQIYTYENKIYRKLMPHEVEQFNAMSKIRIESGKLYFDDKKVKTNASRIKEVYAAYYWNGGVLVVARTSLEYRPKWPIWMLFMEVSEEYGFIDLQTYKCEFVIPDYYRYPGKLLPSFIVPVTINTDNNDIVFDVKIPEKQSIIERLDCHISLTNKSGKSILIPDSLIDGLGAYLDFGETFSEKKYPDVPEKPENKVSLLKPSETRTSVTSFNGRYFFYSPGRYHVIFYWDGFLNPDDKNEMSRFVCEKWIDVTDVAPYHFNKSNTNLVFKVKIPKNISLGEKLDCAISLTNVSNKPILVPAYLTEGLGITKFTPIEHVSGEIEWLDDIKKYPDIPSSPENKHILLMPNETRETIATFTSFGNEPLFYRPGRYRFDFYWYGLLNPKDKYEVSCFTCNENWIEVTK